MVEIDDVKKEINELCESEHPHITAVVPKSKGDNKYNRNDLIKGVITDDDNDKNKKNNDEYLIKIDLFEFEGETLFNALNIFL